MKKYLAAVALASTLVQPAAAVTFPSLTTIYVGSGIRDNFTGQGPRVGTAFNCSNVSGVAATVRFLVLNLDGQLVRSASISVPHGGTRTAVTRLVGTSGVVNIESTQSAVFCNAMIVDTAVAGQGISIPLVRVNPHPGTVE